MIIGSDNNVYGVFKEVNLGEPFCLEGSDIIWMRCSYQNNTNVAVNLNSGETRDFVDKYPIRLITKE